MWDLNDCPDQTRATPDGCCSEKATLDGDDDRGKRVGVGSSNDNSSSSAVVIEASDEDDRDGKSSSSSKIFGFSVPLRDDAVVTRQFFPTTEKSDDARAEAEAEAAAAARGATLPFPRAHWVGVKFCQPEPVGSGKAAVEVSPPIKKSRRGPRSRSSQYRGVTFYRRTGRWESHIWFVISSFPFQSFHLFLRFSAIFSSQFTPSSSFVTGIVESRFIWVGIWCNIRWVFLFFYWVFVMQALSITDLFNSLSLMIFFRWIRHSTCSCSVIFISLTIPSYDFFNGD